MVTAFESVLTYKRDIALVSQLAESLNKDCQCIAVDNKALHRSLEAHLSEPGLSEKLLDSHLFAQSPVFLSDSHVQTMKQIITAIESVIQTQEFQREISTLMPDIARHNFGPRGVFFGYDFHLAAEGPKLIEINTNAGGVLLNLYLADAQREGCTDIKSIFSGKTNVVDIEHQLISMFQEEWSLQRPDQSLKTIAIVDNHPQTQFLYPEFLLFQSLFERHGFRSIIADPKNFDIRDDALYCGDTRIDLVYNRLTSFYLESAECSTLNTAYKNGIAVFTPSPHDYALYADKRNLTLLSDFSRLRQMGVGAPTIEILQRSLPLCVMVTPENAESLWNSRKHYFFKPINGYASRGAYRGAKLTKRVWAEIINSEYIAQQLIPPSERVLMIDGEKQSLKVDIRCVAYKGEVQQMSARLYQGQTTNLRTKGGGLATVFSTDSGSCC